MGCRHLALCSFLAISSALLGCEDESTTSSDTSIQVEPPTMEMVSPADGACIAIKSDPDVRIPFVLKTTWLYLRPPGFCGDAVQCGQLALWVNDKLVTRASTFVVEWDLSSLVERYGQFNIRIAAITDAGEKILDAEGKPLEITRTITTAVSCPVEP